MVPRYTLNEQLGILKFFTMNFGNVENHDWLKAKLWEVLKTSTIDELFSKTGEEIKNYFHEMMKEENNILKNLFQNNGVNVMLLVNQAKICYTNLMKDLKQKYTHEYTFDINDFQDESFGIEDMTALFSECNQRMPTMDDKQQSNIATEGKFHSFN